MPTVLDLAGVPLPEAIHGHSMKQLMGGSTDWPREVAYASQALAPTRGAAPKTTIRDERWTLLIGGKEGTGPELYDLQNDPGQQNNVFSANSDVAERLHRGFLDWLAEVGTDQAKIDALKGM